MPLWQNDILGVSPGGRAPTLPRDSGATMLGVSTAESGIVRSRCPSPLVAPVATPRAARRAERDPAGSSHPSRSPIDLAIALTTCANRQER
jgi:hypothetical protein